MVFVYVNTIAVSMLASIQGSDYIKIFFKRLRFLVDFRDNVDSSALSSIHAPCVLG